MTNAIFLYEISILTVPGEILGMVRLQQARHIRILPSTPVLRTEVVDLDVDEEGETSTARAEDEAGPCIQMTGIVITMHVIACLTDPIVLAAARENL